jgi:opacity protein-like surface antigen
MIEPWSVFSCNPGLIRYFGEKSYVTAFYHRFFTENRGHGQWGTFQGHFALTRMLSPWLGAAAGQRIYNIGDIPASTQRAVVYFAGIDINVSSATTVKAGYSYSRQKPHFTKRSIEAGVLVKF